MNSRILNACALASLMLCGAVHAESSVVMHSVSAEGVGKSLGAVTLGDSEYGVVLTPKLGGLPPGLHGFHLHEGASCAPASKDGKMTAAASAGSHYDPEETGMHGLPWGEGHLGDLPPLYVTADGAAVQPVLAPRLEMADLEGHALMIHEGGDNFSDHPEKLGGGGSRIACGVIE